jgi:hypothetical protein
MQNKAFYLSKTFWTNLIGGALSLLSLSEVTTLVPAKYAPYIVGATAILNVVFRAISSASQGGLTVVTPPKPIESIIDTK